MLSFWRSLNNFGKAVFLTLLSIFTIFLAEVRADYILRDTLNTLSLPVVNVFNGLSNSLLSVGDFVGNIGKLGEENKLLREQVQYLESENAQIEELNRENQLLRDQLNLKQKEGYETTSARVIAKEPIGGVKVVMLNKGSEDGIAVDMPVVISEALLVGYVSETYSHASKVTLLLEPTNEIPARLQKSRADGIVKGQPLGQGLIMELIPQETEVERGNRVITSGLGGNFPPGLLIGYVQTIYQEPNDIFQKADILPAVDFERLEDVLVITNFQPAS